MRYIIIFGLVLFATACTQTATKPHNAREEAIAKGENILKTEPILTTNSPFMNSYLQFTEALVIAKDTLAQQAYNNFKAEINGFTLAKNNINAAVETQILPEIAQLKTLIADSTITNVKTMRIFLKAINKPMLAINKAAKGFGKAIYNSHCPMAFNNKGGNWLSTNDSIRNPYFGDEMLDCGYVEDSIK